MNQIDALDGREAAKIDHSLPIDAACKAHAKYIWDAALKSRAPSEEAQMQSFFHWWEDAIKNWGDDINVMGPIAIAGHAWNAGIKGGSTKSFQEDKELREIIGKMLDIERDNPGVFDVSWPNFRDHMKERGSNFYGSPNSSEEAPKFPGVDIDAVHKVEKSATVNPELTVQSFDADPVGCSYCL